MPGSTAIYDPPKEGLPYLVVTFRPEGMNIATANSSIAVRTIASERVIRRRSERESDTKLVLGARRRAGKTARLVAADDDWSHQETDDPLYADHATSTKSRSRAEMGSALSTGSVGRQ